MKLMTFTGLTFFGVASAAIVVFWLVRNLLNQ